MPVRAPGELEITPAATLRRREVLAALAGVLTAARIRATGLPAAQPQASAPAHEVEHAENVWIPMADGARLAARLWRPLVPEAVPVLLEAIPYRKRDLSRPRDRVYAWYAERGYAVARIDLRGSGDSDGILHDEYLQQEQDDAVEAIAWLARQPWCNGKAGMMGISWGGFAALQVAARQPPALEAIITHCSTDDRFTEDAHWTGGCINNGMFDWGAMFFALLALPPDPAIVGERWHQTWKQRLGAVDLDLANWLRHPTRDAFWKHGSVREDYSRIRCPVYAVGGLVDAYTNTVPRLLEHLEVPVKGLVGPWGHQTPDDANPGPGLGFHQHSLAWWDRWLKDVPNAPLSDPGLTLFVAEETAREAVNEQRDVRGSWLALPQWPPPGLTIRRLHLGVGDLGNRAPRAQRLQQAPDARSGLDVGTWLPAVLEQELPQEQTAEDRRSLVFSGAPIAEPFQLIGRPRLALELDTDRPVAQLVARLCEVRSDGSSWLVTQGAVNLTQRGGNHRIEPLVPGRRERIALELDFAAHRFSVGSRLQLALQTGCFPRLWPSPEPVTLGVYLGNSILELPELPLGLAAAAPFPPPLELAPPALEMTDAPSYERSLDIAERMIAVETVSSGGKVELTDTGTEIERSSRSRFSLEPQNPARARAELHNVLGLQRGSWAPRVETQITVESDARSLHIRAELEAYDGDRLFARRRFDETVARRGF